MFLCGQKLFHRLFVLGDSAWVSPLWWAEVSLTTRPAVLILQVWAGTPELESSLNEWWWLLVRCHRDTWRLQCLEWELTVGSNKKVWSHIGWPISPALQSCFSKSLPLLLCFWATSSLSESSAHSMYTLKSSLDSNKFILHYSAQIIIKKSHIFSQQEQRMVLTQAFLTPNIPLLFLCTLLDTVQIRSYVIFTCHVNVILTPKRNL